MQYMLKTTDNQGGFSGKFVHYHEHLFLKFLIFLHPQEYHTQPHRTGAFSAGRGAGPLDIRAFVSTFRIRPLQEAERLGQRNGGIAMDAMDYFRIYYSNEDPSPYIALKKLPAPPGFEVWIHSFKGGITHICWFKIKCHEQIGYGTATPQAIAKLKATTQDWLSRAGLMLEDFTLARIDYDYNFWLPPAEAETLMETMQQLSERIMRMNKWVPWGCIGDEEDEEMPTVYYQCKSRHAQLYRKDKEREDKGYSVSAAENGMCRQEVQCFSGRIKYMRRKYGIVRDWDNWVTPQMEAEYLTKAEPVFPSGDFYTRDGAAGIIQNSSLSPCHKQRLIEMISTIQSGTMDALKDKYSRNTVKKYLAMLKDLNVNPLTIKPNIYGVDYIKNPFFKRSRI